MDVAQKQEVKFMKNRQEQTCFYEKCLEKYSLGNFHFPFDVLEWDSSFKRHCQGGGEMVLTANAIKGVMKLYLEGRFTDGG